MGSRIHKINVLELNSGFFYAGGARNLYSFCKYLNKDTFNVFAASYGCGGPGEAILKDQRIDYLAADGSVDKVLNYIKKNNIDIIHIHRSGKFVKIEYDILKRAKEFNPNLIIVEKNVFGEYDRDTASFIDCSLFQSMMHLNERYLPRSRQKFNFDKMKVLYNMVDTDLIDYKISQEEISSFKRDVGIKDNDFIIGKIARPHIAKWSDLILEMMPYLVKEIPTAKFLIIGVPRSRIKVIRRSKLNEHFIILDETTDERFVHKFYQTIDVLAHSSKIGECNGNTINEAMFWGKPVVVNSTPWRDNGQLEQVAHMQDGIIANHPQTFARALYYLYKNEDKRKVMGARAKEKVLEINSPQRIVGQLEKVFGENLKKLRPDIEINGLNLKLFDYSPTENDIREYRVIYRQRLGYDFGQLTALEKTVNIFRKPKKFFFKIKDFLEHKLEL